jgi:HlyD family secretion protein
MKKRKLLIGTVLVAAISVVLSGCSGVNSKETSMKLLSIPSNEKVFINGTIVPLEREVIYLDPTKGEVETLSVENGQTVSKGDTLFTYKNEQITEQIAQINLQLESARKERENLLAQKEELKKQEELAKKEAQAQEELLKKQAQEAEKNGSTEELNLLMQQSTPKVQTENFGSSQISTAAVDNQISLYEKQIASLSEKEYYTVTAPIDGRIILSDNERDATQPYIIIESDTFYIEGSVSEKDYPKIKAEQAVEATILSSGEIVTGKISSMGNRPISNAIPAMSQQGSPGSSDLSFYEVKISLDSQDNLINGFHVQAVVELSDSPIEIPKTSLIEEEGKTYVYKVVDNLLVKQEITYKEGESDKVIVDSGLSEEDQIVELPTEEMKEGMPVE